MRLLSSFFFSYYFLLIEEVRGGKAFFGKKNPTSEFTTSIHKSRSSTEDAGKSSITDDVVLEKNRGLESRELESNGTICLPNLFSEEKTSFSLSSLTNKVTQTLDNNKITCNKANTCCTTEYFSISMEEFKQELKEEFKGDDLDSTSSIETISHYHSNTIVTDFLAPSPKKAKECYDRYQDGFLEYYFGEDTDDTNNTAGTNTELNGDTSDTKDPYNGILTLDMAEIDRQLSILGWDKTGPSGISLRDLIVERSTTKKMSSLLEDTKDCMSHNRMVAKFVCDIMDTLVDNLGDNSGDHSKESIVPTSSKESTSTSSIRLEDMIGWLKKGMKKGKNDPKNDPNRQKNALIVKQAIHWAYINDVIVEYSFHKMDDGSTVLKDIFEFSKAMLKENYPNWMQKHDFTGVKYHSILGAMEDITSSDSLHDRFSSVLTKNLVKETILETVVGDLTDKNYANADAGLHLVKTITDFERSMDPTSSTDPTSKITTKVLYDRGGVYDWVRLYESWNIAFVAKLDHFFFSMTKLFIPSVTCTPKNPGPEYYFLSQVTPFYFNLYALIVQLSPKWNYALSTPGEGETAVPIEGGEEKIRELINENLATKNLDFAQKYSTEEKKRVYSKKTVYSSLSGMSTALTPTALTPLSTFTAYTTREFTFLYRGPVLGSLDFGTREMTLSVQLAGEIVPSADDGVSSSIASMKRLFTLRFFDGVTFLKEIQLKNKSPRRQLISQSRDRRNLAIETTQNCFSIFLSFQVCVSIGKHATTSVRRSVGEDQEIISLASSNSKNDLRRGLQKLGNSINVSEESVAFEFTVNGPSGVVYDFQDEMSLPKLELPTTTSSTTTPEPSSIGSTSIFRSDNSSDSEDTNVLLIVGLTIGSLVAFVGFCLLIRRSDYQTSFGREANAKFQKFDDFTPPGSEGTEKSIRNEKIHQNNQKGPKTQGQKKISDASERSSASQFDVSLTTSDEPHVRTYPRLHYISMLDQPLDDRKKNDEEKQKNATTNYRNESDAKPRTDPLFNLQIPIPDSTNNQNKSDFPNDNDRPATPTFASRPSVDADNMSGNTATNTPRDDKTSPSMPSCNASNTPSIHGGLTPKRKKRVTIDVLGTNENIDQTSKSLSKSPSDGSDQDHVLDEHTPETTETSKAVETFGKVLQTTKIVDGTKTTHNIDVNSENTKTASKEGYKEGGADIPNQPEQSQTFLSIFNPFSRRGQ